MSWGEVRPQFYSTEPPEAEVATEKDASVLPPLSRGRLLAGTDAIGLQGPLVYNQM